MHFYVENSLNVDFIIPKINITNKNHKSILYLNGKKLCKKEVRFHY